MQITTNHVRDFITHFLTTSDCLAPLTWTAIPTARDHALRDEDATGLFYWPNEAPLRLLTVDSADRVAQVLIEGLRLSPAPLAGRSVQRSVPVSDLLALFVRRASEVAFAESEVHALLNSAHADLAARTLSRSS